MTPECIKNGDITPDDRSIFNFVVDELGRHDYGTCHEACAALAARFPGLLHRRGRFNGGWEHSWLVLRHRPEVLIDPYPWACASGPVLLTTAGMSPWRFLYVEEPDAPGPYLHPPLTVGELKAAEYAAAYALDRSTEAPAELESLRAKLRALLEYHA